MCRHLAHLGEVRSLEQLLLTPAHGLLRQSWAPRRQAYGTVNADGFGAGWYDPGRPTPARYRRAVPMWADASFASLAGVVRSGCVLAAVRSASEGTPVEESAVAPFLLGDVLLSHNGRVDRAALGPLVPSADLARIGSTVDSAYVAALVLARCEAGDPLGPALRAAVRAAAGQDPSARLNLLATDGRRVAAATWGDTHVVRVVDGSVLVASEPTDDGAGWEPLPDRSLLMATPDGCVVEEL